MCELAYKYFTSSEDGAPFVSALEAFPKQILDVLSGQKIIKPSFVDHMLAIIKKNGEALVYINELSMILMARPKRRVEKGDPVSRNDIVDIESLTLDKISIPNDSGILFLFSVDWKKGLFFDFGPLLNPPIERDYNLEILLGSLYAYLDYQRLFKLQDVDWQEFFNQGWFPFISLSRETIKDLCDFAQNKWDIDELLEKVAKDVASFMSGLPDRWAKKDFMQPHINLLKHATEKYLQGDYISTASILYPRIEGIMRELYENKEKKPSQMNLVDSVVQPLISRTHEHSFLLPQKFKLYLQEVYFKSFEPGKPAQLSRHSIAHGVANSDLFNQKAAIIGILIIDQIFFSLPQDKKEVHEK